MTLPRERAVSDLKYCRPYLADSFSSVTPQLSRLISRRDSRLGKHQCLYAESRARYRFSEMADKYA